MKKSLTIFIFLVSFVLTSNASAMPLVPFEVGTGGTIDTSAFGIGVFDYDAVASGPFDLGEGDTTPLLTFFDITFAALAAGQVSVEIDLLSPTPDTPVGDSGGFLAVGFISPGFSIGTVAVDWGNPVQFGYSFNGMGGGILELDLLDIDTGFLLKGPASLSIQGYLTNVQNPDPVPEPATVLLFGAGLAALVGVKRYQKKK